MKNYMYVTTCNYMYVYIHFKVRDNMVKMIKYKVKEWSQENILKINKNRKKI